MDKGLRDLLISLRKQNTEVYVDVRSVDGGVGVHSRLVQRPVRYCLTVCGKQPYLFVAIELPALTDPGQGESMPVNESSDVLDANGAVEAKVRKEAGDNPEGCVLSG